jgi:hypothetical protein
MDTAKQAADAMPDRYDASYNPGDSEDSGVRRLGRHKVIEVVQKGTNFVIFRDDFGLTWRYLRDWRRAWPVWVNVKW